MLKPLKKNNLISLPNLTPYLIDRCIPDSEATVQVHIIQECQGLQSTTKYPSTYTTKLENKNKNKWENLTSMEKL